MLKANMNAKGLPIELCPICWPYIDEEGLAIAQLNLAGTGKSLQARLSH